MKKAVRIVVLFAFIIMSLILISCQPPVTPTPTPPPTPPTTAPSAPASPSLTPGDAVILADWNAVGGAASYNVFYHTVEDSSTATQFGGDITQSNASITGLANETLYYVWIIAKNSIGSSPYSLSSCAITLGAAAPGEAFEGLGGGVDADVSRFNGKAMYIMATAEPALKPEANAAAADNYAAVLTSTGSPMASARSLQFNSWVPGTIGRSETGWYYFNATVGIEHEISWDDSFEGSNAYTADLRVSAYREDLTTTYFLRIDSGYDFPWTITPAATEKVFLKVENYFADDPGGTFAIRDATTDTPSMAAPGLNEASLSKTKDEPMVFKQAQAQTDLFMRETENMLLSGRAPQVSKRPPGIDAAAPSPIEVGTAWTGVYIVINGTTINATCQYISDNAYFFVDDRDTAAMSPYLASYGTAFDAIADVNHADFGTENDVDSNGKVIIVFSEELTGGLLGYFYAADKYPKATYATSNEGDIFYITTDVWYQGEIANGTLAHEFQHMIYFDEHYDRGVTSTFSWLNEALSQAAEYYNGYTDNHLSWIWSFLNNGGYSGAGPLSLTHWTSSNYGYGAIWIRYIIDRFGVAVIRNMCATDLVGIAAVEDATGMDFNTLFLDFSRAIVMDGTGDSANPIYGFASLDLAAVQPQGRGGFQTVGYYEASRVYSADIRAYTLNLLKLNGIFDTMNLSGADIYGTAFGLSR